MSFIVSAEFVYKTIEFTSSSTHSQNSTKMDVTPGQNTVEVKCSALIEAIKQQDESALAELYDLTVERVYGLALSMTSNTDDAEEVVGDVYLKVWQRAFQYQAERGQLIGWLLVTCRSAALDLLRRRKRRAAREQPQAELPDISDGITAETLLNTLQEGTHVHTALATLSAVQRRLIGLAFFHDMSHSEIAACVQMPVGTVKSHIRRGLQSLRQTIDV